MNSTRTTSNEARCSLPIGWWRQSALSRELSCSRLGLSAAGSSGLADRVIEHKLANGMTVLDGGTASSAGRLDQHDLRGRRGQRTGRPNRPGPSLRAHGIQGHAARSGRRITRRKSRSWTNCTGLEPSSSNGSASMARRGADMPVEPRLNERAIEELQKRFKELARPGRPVCRRQ